MARKKRVVPSGIILAGEVDSRSLHSSSDASEERDDCRRPVNSIMRVPSVSRAIEIEGSS